MSVQTLICCDFCPAELKLHLALAPRDAMRQKGWTSWVADGKTCDACPDCRSLKNRLLTPEEAP